mmetsp:Transcript_7609/g.16492  ORF Transcript_7609/g.16492 Transcript_7609/m.16492 type:complete len:281 (-) Transcript_7609:1125-1967(-)
MPEIGEGPSLRPPRERPPDEVSSSWAMLAVLRQLRARCESNDAPSSSRSCCRRLWRRGSSGLTSQPATMSALEMRRRRRLLAIPRKLLWGSPRSRRRLSTPLACGPISSRAPRSCSTRTSCAACIHRRDGTTAGRCSRRQASKGEGMGSVLIPTSLPFPLLLPLPLLVGRVPGGRIWPMRMMPCTRSRMAGFRCLWPDDSAGPSSGSTLTSSSNEAASWAMWVRRSSSCWARYSWLGERAGMGTTMGAAAALLEASSPLGEAVAEEDAEKRSAAAGDVLE